MRERLFRGKREDNGEWVEGWVFKTYCKTGIQEKGHFKYFNVLPETVGQYTGLTDKNGTKIFEGDIVAGALFWQERPKNGLVTFRDGSFGLLWYRGEAEQFNPFTSMCNIEYEVIGNIHDNPELLRVMSPTEMSGTKPRKEDEGK